MDAGTDPAPRVMAWTGSWDLSYCFATDVVNRGWDLCDLITSVRFVLLHLALFGSRDRDKIVVIQRVGWGEEDALIVL